MVGLPYDCLANPLGAVRLTFEKAISSGSHPATFNGKDWGTVDLIRRYLNDEGGLAQVPVLDHATRRLIQPNTLVRFRGMIQDMLGNEFYVGAYKNDTTWRTNKFLDVPQFPIDTLSETQIWERRLLYCVPVPGLNSWTQTTSETALNQFTNSSSQHREKRQREDDGSIDDMVSDVEVQTMPSIKKMREGELASHPSQIGELINEGSCSTTSAGPILDTTLSCVVKIYDSPESDLKLNDVFEFVGVYTFAPELIVDENDPSNLSDELSEDVLTQLPPSKIPRLHCFVHRKLANSDFLCSSPSMQPNPHLFKEIREALLVHLTAILGNDGLAANFMLLHLLSRVHARTDAVAVGKFALNFTTCSKEKASVFSKQLTDFLNDLLPFTHCLSLTVDYLNSNNLGPKKDYQSNRLVSGGLQLAEGSHLTIDETQLEPGTLNPVGVENVRLLKNLTETQKVEYDFTYYKMEMTADVQILILSDGKSNILPADIVVPFHPSSVGSSEAITMEALEAWRWFLATLRSLSHTIELDMQKVVEDDLVAARQADRMLGSQDFSRLLTIGRLISVSFGETCLSPEHWQMAKELERLRRERLKC